MNYSEKILVDEEELANELAVSFVASDLPVVEGGSIRNAGLYLLSRENNTGSIAISKDRDVFETVIDPFIREGDSGVPTSFSLVQFEGLNPVTRWGIDIPEGYFVGKIKQDLMLKVMDNYGLSKAKFIANNRKLELKEARINLFGMTVLADISASHYFKSLYARGSKKAIMAVDSYVRLISKESKLEENESAGELRHIIINRIGVTLKSNLGITSARDYYVLSESNLDSLYRSGLWKEGGCRFIGMSQMNEKVSSLADVNVFAAKFRKVSSKRKLLNMKIDLGEQFNHSLGSVGSLSEAIKKGQHDFIASLYSEKLKENSFDEVCEAAHSVGEQDAWDLVYKCFPESGWKIRNKISSKAKRSTIQSDFEI